MFKNMISVFDDYIRDLVEFFVHSWVKISLMNTIINVKSVLPASLTEFLAVFASLPRGDCPLQ